MGKMETWELVGRTDETMTFVYKRRCYKEETFPMSSGNDYEEEEDEEPEPESESKKSKKKSVQPTARILNKLEKLCKDVRKKHRIEKKKESKKAKKSEQSKKSKTVSESESSKSSKPSKLSTSTPSKKPQRKEPTLTVESNSYTEDSEHVIVNGMKIKKGTKNEKCDYRGVPLSHPMAVTPYPGAATAAQREKARKLLQRMAQRLYDEEQKRDKKLAQEKKGAAAAAPSIDSAAKTTASANSEKTGKTEKSSIASSDKTKTPVKTTSSNGTGSVKSSAKSSAKSGKSSTKSRSSNKKMGCDKCGSCQKCIHRCSQKHTTSDKVTDYERETFLNDIKRLRQRIVKPERSRERAVKSPYDVTQSDSDSDLSSEHSKSARASKKNSKEK